MQNLFQNKAVGLHYQVADKLEVGIQLFGWEVKSLKAGRFNLSKAFVDYSPGEGLYLREATVSVWPGAIGVASQVNRPRKLLAHAREAAKMGMESKKPGFTLVPLSLYVNDRGIIKLQLALVKGKRKFEKRQVIKERDLKRELQQEMKQLQY